MKMWKFIGIVSIVVLALVIGIGVYKSLTLNTGYIILENGIELPSYAFGSQDIKSAYIYAVTHPEDLDGVPCKCGCMQYSHEGRVHKRGLLDCFMKGDGSFDHHASECDMCISDALKTQKIKGRV